MSNGNLDDLWKFVHEINSDGCARRGEDSNRLTALEELVGKLEKKLDRKLDRIFYGVIGLMGAVIIKMVLG